MNVIDEDAPVNATGAAVSTDTPLVRSRNRYKDKNKKKQRNSILAFSKDTTTNMLKFLNWAAPIYISGHCRYSTTFQS